MKTTTDVHGQQIEYDYVYNASVSQKKVKLNGNLYATYNFDDASRLTSVANASDGAMVSFGYDDENKITSRVYPNGITTAFEYDGMDRLDRLFDSGGSVNADRSYGLNDAG